MTFSRTPSIKLPSLATGHKYPSKCAKPLDKIVYFNESKHVPCRTTNDLTYHFLQWQTIVNNQLAIMVVSVCVYVLTMTMKWTEPNKTHPQLLYSIYITGRKTLLTGLAPIRFRRIGVTFYTIKQVIQQRIFFYINDTFVHNNALTSTVWHRRTKRPKHIFEYIWHADIVLLGNLCSSMSFLVHHHKHNRLSLYIQTLLLWGFEYELKGIYL